MNLYTPGDVEGSFIIDAGISYAVGQPFEYDVLQRDWNPPYALAIEISILSPEGSGPVYTGPFLASVNSTENEVPFPLLDVPPSFDPYHVTLTAVMVPGGKQIYTASTLLYKLPYRTDGGSVAKLDSLYGGILVQDYLTGSHTWEAILPYSFYVSWDGWLEKSLNNVQKFKDQGYNILHIVPNAGLPNQAFNFTELDLFLDKCDEIGLWLMYDMRWTYKNLTEVEEQVDRLKSRKSMLLWYTGDEPDGQGDPLDAPKLAYDRIKSLDPWHPVSLCLNCYNFYYEDYSSGADIILSDVYPVAIDATWSAVYDTVCNATYGCCGCDDCKGEFEDISNRLDLFAQYQGWIGGGPKTYWGVPQAFGNESFWIRYPTAAEEVTMNMLSINHNAKGIVMWDYPTSEELGDVTSALARVLASRDVTRFLLGAPTVALKVTSGQQRIDAAGWRVGNRMLVSILYLDYSALSSRVAVALPFGGARSIEKTLGFRWLAGVAGPTGEERHGRTGVESRDCRVA